MSSYLAHGPEIYPKAHENPRTFSCIFGPIFLESSIQCPWGVGLHQDLHPVSPFRTFTIYRTLVQTLCTHNSQIENKSFSWTLQEKIQNWNTINSSTSLVTLTKNNTLKKLKDKDWIHLKCGTLWSSIFLHKLINTWL